MGKHQLFTSNFTIICLSKLIQYFKKLVGQNLYLKANIVHILFRSWDIIQVLVYMCKIALFGGL